LPVISSKKWPSIRIVVKDSIGNGSFPPQAQL
jgi:hypothetical protein